MTAPSTVDDLDAVRRIVEQSRAAQGLPAKVTNPDAVEKAVGLLRAPGGVSPPPERERRAKRGSPSPDPAPPRPEPMSSRIARPDDSDSIDSRCRQERADG